MREVYSTLGRISAFIFIGFVAITVGDYGNLIVSKYFNESDKESINEVLLKIASDMNESLPITVNSEINLVSIKSGDRMFRYNYQLINYTSTDAPQEVINSTKQYAFNQFCSERDTKQFRDHDVTVEYAYYGNDGKQITVVSITLSYCKNN